LICSTRHSYDLTPEQIENVDSWNWVQIKRLHILSIWWFSSQNWLKPAMLNPTICYLKNVKDLTITNVKLKILLVVFDFYILTLRIIILLLGQLGSVTLPKNHGPMEPILISWIVNYKEHHQLNFWKLLFKPLLYAHALAFGLPSQVGSRVRLVHKRSVGTFIFVINFNSFLIKLNYKLIDR
jgi:hypothetical protein